MKCNALGAKKALKKKDVAMRKYTHLSQEERILIGHYQEKGMSGSQIGRLLGRHKTTVSRELKRNSNQVSYNPQTALNRYLVRRKRPCLLDRDQDLRRYVVERLQEGFSPELIALRLKKMGDIEKLRPINHESIYQWLYRPAQKREKLYRLLAQSHATRGRRKRVHRSTIPNRTSVHERPLIATQRQEVGHWEADLMAFQGNRQHMLVIHERHTRYTASFRLKSKRAEETLSLLLAFFKRLPNHLRRSVTFDNGSEFTLHSTLQKELRMKTYFCDVYASWQKGGIENMNGRLRRDLPRKTDLLAMQDEDFEQILLTHNLMPRKVLQAKSPIEALANHLGKCIFFSFNHGVALHR